MSIHDEIKRYHNNRLFLLSSEFAGEETPRTIYYTPEVAEIFENAAADGENWHLFAEGASTLDAFIELGQISFAMDPNNKAFDAQMARTGPVELGVVDFRIIYPKPGLRIFGCFSEPDTFVALTWHWRDGIEEGEFGLEVKRCRDVWKELFPNHQPHMGSNANDYITANTLVG